MVQVYITQAIDLQHVKDMKEGSSPEPPAVQGEDVRHAPAGMDDDKGDNKGSSDSDIEEILEEMESLGKGILQESNTYVILCSCTSYFVEFNESSIPISNVCGMSPCYMQEWVESIHSSLSLVLVNRSKYLSIILYINRRSLCIIS